MREALEATKDEGTFEGIYAQLTKGFLKRIGLQITDSVGRLLSVQDARMGFHICIVGY